MPVSPCLFKVLISKKAISSCKCSIMATNFENELFSDAMEILPSCKSTLGSSSQHGWVWDDINGVYDPVITELSPTLESKVSAKRRRCNCKKNGFVCCELCHRKSLENIEENLCPEDFVAGF